MLGHQVLSGNWARRLVGRSQHSGLHPVLPESVSSMLGHQVLSGNGLGDSVVVRSIVAAMIQVRRRLLQVFASLQRRPKQPGVATRVDGASLHPFPGVFWAALSGIRYSRGLDLKT